jgi:hypothetical protein
VNCCVGIGDFGCLGSDVGGVRAGVEDGLDRVVLGAGVLFLFSYYFPLSLFPCSLRIFGVLYLYLCIWHLKVILHSSHLLVDLVVVVVLIL